jgi:integrase
MQKITKPKRPAKSRVQKATEQSASLSTPRRTATQTIGTTKALAVRDVEHGLVVRDEDDEHADALSEHAHAPATERAYSTDLEDWRRYALEQGPKKGFYEPFFPVLPMQLRKYIASMDRRGLSVSTIRRRCAAIARLHSNEGVTSPTRHPDVTKVLRGLARERNVVPVKKTAITPGFVIAALKQMHEPRDRALLLFGICSAMRRSEIVSIRWREVIEKPKGLEVRIASSKTDKEGRGAIIGLLRIDAVPEYCPVRALWAWKTELRPKPDDFVFPICAQTLANVVKRAATLVGLNAELYGGHSFRSGFATNAAESGVPMVLWMKHTRHLSDRSASGYAQAADALGNPAVAAMSNAIQAAAQQNKPPKRKATRHR